MCLIFWPVFTFAAVSLHRGHLPSCSLRLDFSRSFGLSPAAAYPSWPLLSGPPHLCRAPASSHVTGRSGPTHGLLPLLQSWDCFCRPHSARLTFQTAGSQPGPSGFGRGVLPPLQLRWGREGPLCASTLLCPGFPGHSHDSAPDSPCSGFEPVIVRSPFLHAACNLTDLDTQSLSQASLEELDLQNPHL